MRIKTIKDVVVNSNVGMSALDSNVNKTVALCCANLMFLRSSILTLIAATTLSISTSALSASEHEGPVHEASKQSTDKLSAHKAVASEKVYPARAVQGVVEPLPPGASLHKMTLSHHELEPWTFVPKRKDRIEIKNTSNLTHALYVTYPDGTVVNLEVQIPGDVVTWNVPEDADGEYLFRCWVHPVIRAKMTIQE